MLTLLKESGKFFELLYLGSIFFLTAVAACSRFPLASILGLPIVWGTAYCGQMTLAMAACWLAAITWFKVSDDRGLHESV